MSLRAGHHMFRGGTFKNKLPLGNTKPSLDLSSHLAKRSIGQVPHEPHRIQLIPVSASVVGVRRRRTQYARGEKPGEEAKPGSHRRKTVTVANTKWHPSLSGRRVTALGRNSARLAHPQRWRPGSSDGNHNKRMVASSPALAFRSPHVPKEETGLSPALLHTKSRSKVHARFILTTARRRP